MAYRISTTDGTIITVNDLQNNTSDTSLTLIGRGQINFGEPMAANLVHMLENWSNPNPPVNPIRGQVWYQTTTGVDATPFNRLKVYTADPTKGTVGFDQGWIVVGAPVASATPPVAPNPGDLWFDNVHNQLYYYTGTQWEMTSQPYASTTPPLAVNGTIANGTPWLMLPEAMLWVYDSALSGPFPAFVRDDNTALAGNWRLVGPSASVASGTVVVGQKMTDTGSAAHQVLLTYVNGSVTSIESSSSFTPASLPSGFTSPDGTIHAGITLNQSLSPKFGGDALSADKWSTARTGTFDGSWIIGSTAAFDGSNNFVITVTGFGPSADSHINSLVSSGVSSSGVVFKNGSTTGFSGNLGSSGDHFGTIFASAFTASGAINGATVVASSSMTAPTFNGNLSGATVAASSSVSAPTLSGTNVSVSNDVSAGASMHAPNFYGTFNGNLNGTATSADYADLAERYEADAVYPVGTIVKIGGDKEITATDTLMDTESFGVISEAPAYLMNAGAGDQDTHPAVGLIGRVPVRVEGIVKKGQRIVASATPGVGMALSGVSGADIMSIVGRALESNDTTDEKLVLCAIGMR